MTSLVPNRRRNRAHCSVLALATVLAVGATPARADSLLGTHSFATNSGGAANVTHGLTSTTVTLNPGNTVINWTPTNTGGTGNVVFQNSGTIATFTSADDFAVLNNINGPAGRAIEMNGTINTTVGGAQRGSVYFYSADGFVFGNSSVFNVGALGVTTLPVSNAAFAALGGTGFGSLVFGQATNANSAIVMGGTVNASSQPTGVLPPGNSYVALVAPRVVHNGTITANGSTALVAAEAATINFTTDGLFDIQVTVGSDEALDQGLNVHGDITGPTPTGAGDQQRIFLVAVPKNDAMTMVIGNGADLGFTLANSAVDDNGVIVLSAGHDVIDGAIAGKSAGHGANATGNFWFTGAHATNDVVARATGQADLYSVAGQPTTTFDNDVTVRADGGVSMGASGVGTTLTVSGNLSLSADRSGAAGQSATAGDVDLYASNSGTVTVSGATDLSADGTGGNASSGSAGSGTGGTVEIYRNTGGTLSIGALTISAIGTGGNGLAAGVHGGDGTGGTISISSSGTGNLTFGNALLLDVQGYGGSASGLGLAGDGSGGLARIYVGDNAGMTFNANVTLDSDGHGGAHASGVGGMGFGGFSRLTAVLGSTAGGLMTFNGNVELSADGTGGASASAGTGGDGFGGGAYMYSTAHHYVINGNLNAHANGQGGSAASGTGGAGYGGDAYIQSAGSEVDISGTVSLYGEGRGGTGGTGGGEAYGGMSAILASSSGSVELGGLTRMRSNGIAGTGAYGEGGETTISASTGGDISIAILNAAADGSGGADTGAGAGDGQGGDALIQASGAGSTITVIATPTSGGIQNIEMLSADGFGGDTSVGGATAGTGTGGTSIVKALSGGSIALPMTADASFVRARGYGGLPLANSTTGGLGVGGYGELYVDGGTVTANLFQISVIGQGGTTNVGGINSHGGDGIGGERHVNVLNGGIITLSMNGGFAAGIGGDGTGTGSGGDGSGGEATLTVDNATANFTGNTLIVVNNTGGAALGTGSGGNASGGTATGSIRNGGVVNMTGSSQLTVSASTVGGNAGGSGTGGNATAGSSNFTISGGAFNGGTLLLNGFGQAGGGATGGLGQGGQTSLDLTNATVTNAAITLDARGLGGSVNSGTGGNGIGGNAVVNSLGGTNSLTLTGSGLSIYGSGTGGSVLTGAGAAGNGTGGNAKLYAYGGSNLTVSGSLTADASGTGGNSIEDGPGGAGQGGTAEVGAYGGGLLTLNGPLSILGTGIGGNGTGAAGGDGTGKRASLFADGGSLIINGSVDMSASGEGGNGTTGGDGTGGGEVFVNIDGAHIYAKNGSIAITGNTVVNSSGYGGNGADGGSGGDGSGGFATIHAANSNSGPSSVTITGIVEDSANVFAEGHGGAGGHGTNGGDAGNGGSGGNGYGGWAGMTAAAGNGHLDIEIANLSAQAWGGQGGDGGNSDGGVGGNGGLGGNAFGGGINVGTESGFAEALGSNLGLGEYGSIYADSSAHGGDGGDGTGGSTNGNGGDGGDATSGFATLLVRGSTVDAGTVDLAGNATGGDAGFGYVPNEGTPGTTGIGGDATLRADGSIFVLATNRFGITAQRGTLLAGSINGESIATGGIGIPDGDVAALGGNGVEILNSDAEIGSLNFNIGIGENANNETVSGYDFVSVINGTVDTSAGFSFSAPGDFSLFVDQGWLSAGTLTLTASNFIYDPAAPAIVSLGTTLAGDAFITTDDNFVADTNWDVANNFIVDAPGLIELDNVVGGAGIDFSAGESISITSLDAGTYVDLLAAGAIGTGPILAGTTVNIQSTGSSVTVPSIDAGGNVTLRGGTTVTAADIISGGNIFTRSFGGDTNIANLDASGNIQLYSSEDVLISGTIEAGGNLISLASGLFDANDVTTGGYMDIGTAGGINADDLVAGDYIYLHSNGPISLLTARSAETIRFETESTLTTGNLTAGDSVLGLAMGAINVGNVSAGIVDQSFAPGAQYRASFASDANITTGTVTALGNIGFSTPGNLLTGNLDSSGEGIMALVGGNISLPTANADGYVFLADHSMGELGGDFYTFNRAAVLAAPVVPTGGSIAISGPLMAGTFVTAAAGTSLTTSTIDAGGAVNLYAGGAMNLGEVNAGLFDAQAGSTFTAPDITSDSDLDIEAGGNITVGHLVAGLTTEEAEDVAMRIISDGSVSFIDINALDGVDITALGSVTGGNVTTGRVLFTDAVGAIQYGNISAGLVSPQPQSSPFSIGLLSGTSIEVGTVDAAYAAAFISVGTIETGNINAGTDVLGLANGDINLGDIDAGARVYLADYSMYSDLGGTIPTGESVDEADIETIFSASPIPTNGSITVGDVSAGSFTASAGTSLTLGILDVDGGLSIEAGNAITTGDLDVGDFVLANGGSITTGDINSESVDMTSTAGNITTGDILAFGEVELDAFGDILTGDITAGSIDLLAGDDITTGNLTTQQLLLLALNDGPIQTLSYPGASITLQSGGDILAGNLDSIDGVYADAGGSLTTGTIQAVDFIELHSVGNMQTGNISAGTDVFAHTTNGNMLVGNIVAGQDLTLAALGTMTGGTVNAGGVFMGLAHGDMLFGDVTAGEVFLADYVMLAPGGIIVSCVGNCGSSGADGVVSAPPTGPTYLYVSTDGGVHGGGTLPGQEASSTNGSRFTTAEFSAAAGEVVDFWFNYVTTDGSGFADYAWAALLTTTFDPVAILFTARTQPEGTIVPGQNLPNVEATLNPSSVPIIPGGPEWSPLGADSGDCYAAGCGYTGWVNSTYQIAEAGNYILNFGVSNWSDNGFQSGMAFSAITVGGNPVPTGLVPTGGSITIGNVVTGKMTAAAGTTLTTGTINSTGSVDLYSGGNMLTGAITAGTDLFADAGGTMTLGVISGDDIELFSVGNMSFVSANAGTEIDFETDGNLNGGAITAGNQISGDADGTITLANLTVTDPVLEDEQFSIGIEANGNISVGNASAPGPIGFATQGNLMTGNISAGDLFMTLVGGNTTINGSITTTGEGGGQVYMADDSMFATGGGNFNESDDDFDKDIVLALSPVATGGSISIAGTVNTGWFRGAAGTTFTTHAVNAWDATIFAGGTAVIDGAWDVGDAEIVSDDIDITANGSIEAGDINLISKNATRTVVGDGVNQAGYNLSNAEFGRLSANDINVVADTARGAAPTMLLGALNYTPSASEGGIEIMFLTGNYEAESAAGTIRVLGNVAFNGMTSDEHEVDFVTGRFELDAATGSLSLLSSGSTIGGSLDFYASRIHVAAGSILDQLASNPTYSGYQQALNQPASVQRPEGVLRADTIYIKAEGLQGVLIQNTGGQGGPAAGFLVRDVTIPVEEAGSPPGSINLVVNGQVVTDGGTLTGVAARDALITPADTGLAAFTSNSTINGCPLTGECIIRPPEPPPTANVVDNQIDLFMNDPLGDSDFGNEPEIDDNEEGDEAAENPISPPQPLFDTRPLIPGGDVNDPVSGTGNPALVGSEQECEPGENGQCPANPAEGDAQ